MKKIIMIVLLLVIFPLQAATERFEFINNRQREEFYSLIKELRCMTCPNQSIADSNAPIAQAMQELVYECLMKGESSELIKENLMNVYGNKVSFNPPWHQTKLLWLAPILLIAFGFYRWIKACQ